MASANSAAAQINSMDALNDETKLNNGDEISYRVIEDEDPPAELVIGADGEIQVPLLGRYPAAGKTCKQLAQELKPLLQKEYFYTATVIIGIDTVSTASKGRVFLTGQVQHQGAVDLPSNETLTVSKVILLDGGLTDFADRGHVKLIHKNADGSSTTTVVNLKEVLDRGHFDKDAVVQPGDTINVPEQLITF